MKGRTIIELVDAKTGEREVVAENNMIGTAVQEIFNLTSKGALETEVVKHLFPLHEKMFGGILLFENVVSETAKRVPADNKVVGAGAYNHQTLTSTINGDYNPTESEVTDTYVKHVWDFKTSQANGKISSICLCDSVYPRQAWYGSDTSTTFPSASTYIQDSREYNDFILPVWGWGNSYTIDYEKVNLAIFGNSGGTWHSYSPHYIFFENDFSGYTTIELEDSTTLVFKKWVKTKKIAVNTKSGITWLNGNPTPAYSPVKNFNISPSVSEEKKFTLPITFVGRYVGVIYDNSTQKLYLTVNSSNAGTVAKDATLPILVFDFSNSTDLANVSMTQKTFTNRTGETVYLGNVWSSPVSLSYATNSQSIFGTISGGFVFTVNASRTAMYKIDIEDDTKITKLTSEKFTKDLPYEFHSQCDGLLYFYDGYNGSGFMIINKETGAFGTWGGGAYRNVTNRQKITLTKYNSPYFLVQRIETAGAGGGTALPSYPFTLRNYLSTINNLPSPVTKTSDKTMKVTYILEPEA